MLLTGDTKIILPTLESASVQTVITSPPYWGLRDYGVEGQIGLEATPEAYVDTLVEVFREVKRVLRDDGTVWLNLGDSYAGSGKGQMGDGTSANIDNKQSTNKGSSTGGLPTQYPGLKPKDLVGIPWRVAFALQADGWYLRSDIIWAKGISFCDSYSGSVMPESVTDRPTKGHEYLFLLSKSPRYYYDAGSIQEKWADDRKGAAAGSNWVREETKTASKRRPQDAPKTNGRNIRSVWTITPTPFNSVHFATFPMKLVEPCVKAGSKPGDTVLDPFAGSGTTGIVAQRLGRDFIGIELNPAYVSLAQEHLEGPLFAHDAQESRS